MAKVTTDFSSSSKNTTGWNFNSVLDDAVKLNDATVTLGSTTVTLLGLTSGSHFYDNRIATDFTTASKSTTDFTGSSKNTTDFTVTSKTTTDWSTP